jgi:hypothetical protein
LFMREFSEERSMLAAPFLQVMVFGIRVRGLPNLAPSLFVGT